jgi:hypothetical protein
MISEAARRQRPLSRFWRHCVDRDPELRAFERSIRDLDDRLRADSQALPNTVSESLQEDLLRAIRQEQSQTSSPVRPTSPPTLWRASLTAAAVCAVVALLTLGYWKLVSRPQSDPVATVQTPQATPQALPPSLPSPDILLAQLGAPPDQAVPDPMTDQLEALSLDAQSAARFLLRSLP